MPSNEAPPDDLYLLRVDEAAQRLGVAKGTIYNLISAGELRVVHVAVDRGRAKSRIRSDDLVKFIEGRTQDSRRLYRR